MEEIREGGHGGSDTTQPQLMLGMENIKLQVATPNLCSVIRTTKKTIIKVERPHCIKMYHKYGH